MKYSKYQKIVLNIRTIYFLYEDSFHKKELSFNKKEEGNSHELPSHHTIVKAV